MPATKDDSSHATLWTIGHSTLNVDDFVERLMAWHIDLLIDVRTVPRSRHNPQFNADTLPAVLSLAGIDHRHEKTLGGLREPNPDSTNTGLQNPGFRGYADHMQTERFQTCITHLIDEATTHRICLMCAEASPWHCHRSLLCDTLTTRCMQVEHILTLTETTPHKLNPFARPTETGVTYPGLL